MHTGRSSDCAYLIVVGSVEAQLPNGRKADLAAGEVFGEMGLIDQRPRSATVVAKEYTVCATYSENELMDVIRQAPDEALALMRALISRLRDADKSRN